mmetsp:Transcript_2338/g.6593  ORF Transcript_2338/g.6593 Transcript_2338/m.6593 type:complete len:336 (-) Transcript_2338:282-1289(-)
MEQLCGPHVAVAEHDLRGLLHPGPLVGLESRWQIPAAAGERVVQRRHVEHCLPRALRAERQKRMGGVPQQGHAPDGPGGDGVAVEERVASDLVRGGRRDDLGVRGAGVREAALREHPVVDKVLELGLRHPPGPGLLAGLAPELGGQDRVRAVDAPVQQGLAVPPPALADRVEHRGDLAGPEEQHGPAVVDLGVDLQDPPVDAPAGEGGPLPGEELRAHLGPNAVGADQDGALEARLTRALRDVEVRRHAGRVLLEAAEGVPAVDVLLADALLARVEQRPVQPGAVDGVLRRGEARRLSARLPEDDGPAGRAVHELGRLDAGAAVGLGGLEELLQA